MITADQARELLNYDPNTGVFTRRVRTSKRIHIGDIAGCKSDQGYLKISLLGKQFRAHRLAWLIVNGEWPADHIDHINGVRDDNRWINLRSVSQKENMRNECMRKDNTSGVVGVYWYKNKQKWKAQIVAKDKLIHLGYFTELSAAAAARKAAEQKYGYHENHGRI